MLRKQLLPILVLLLTAGSVWAQGVGVNILNPDSSAILHLESNEKGLLLPNLTTPEMDGINNPAEGLVIYNTTDSLVEYWNGRCWLKAYQRSCDECEFITTLDNFSATIDRATTDSAVTNLTVERLNGNDSIATIVLASLPSGITASITNPIVDSFGVVTITVTADIFAPAGTYPILIQSVCGQNSFIQAFTVEVEPCLQVDVAANYTNLDLQNEFGLPGPGQPECIIVDVEDGVEVTSNDPTVPAFTWGNLDPLSHVGLRHDGSILGRGGDGSGPGSLLSLSFINPGGDGGDALELTTRTTFDVSGEIYGGGGGGGGVGTGADLNLVSLPVIGSIGVCLAAGSGGGGGAAGGTPGTAAGSCSGSGPLYFTFTFVEDGTAGSGGPGGTGGDGGVIFENVPINVSVAVATLSISPFVDISGGDGGDYGQAGGTGSGSVGVSIDVSVPFLGSIFNDTFSFTLVTAAGGAAGLAIKTNSNTFTGLPLPSTFVIGNVAP